MIVACSQYMSRDIYSIEEWENHVKDHLEQAVRKGSGVDSVSGISGGGAADAG